MQARISWLNKIMLNEERWSWCCHLIPFMATKLGPDQNLIEREFEETHKSCIFKQSNPLYVHVLGKKSQLSDVLEQDVQVQYLLISFCEMMALQKQKMV